MMCTLENPANRVGVLTVEFEIAFGHEPQYDQTRTWHVEGKEHGEATF